MHWGWKKIMKNIQDLFKVWVSMTESHNTDCLYNSVMVLRIRILNLWLLLGLGKWLIPHINHVHCMDKNVQICISSFSLWPIYSQIIPTSLLIGHEEGVLGARVGGLNSGLLLPFLFSFLFTYTMKVLNFLLN